MEHGEVAKPEILSPSDVISCLWSQNSVEKCRVGLSDVLIYENGSPARWYVTGKTGEVTKKRSIDIDSITQRWIRISSQSQSNFMAIIRQQGGIIKILSPEAWSSFISGGLQDSSILSLHCFVRGNNHTYYRNSFRLRDKYGRFSSSTMSYALPQIDTPENVVMVCERDCKFTECKATSIRNIMDLATNTVIRYLENMLGIKIAEISIDYAIDIKSQLWMLWTSEAVFFRGNNLSELNIEGLKDHGNAGRMSWAGLKYAETFQDAVKDGLIIPSPIRTVHSREKNRYKNEQKAEISELSNQLSVIENTMETHFHKIQSRNSTTTSKTHRDLSTPQYQAMISGIDGNSSQTFPNAFKCHGDYCNLCIETIGSLYTDNRVKQDHLTTQTNSKHYSNAIQNSQNLLKSKLFSENELQLLENDQEFAAIAASAANSVASSAASSAANATYVIALKSILLARQERRGPSGGAQGTLSGLLAVGGPPGKGPSSISIHNNDNIRNGNPWDKYPLTPRQKSASMKLRLSVLDAPGGSVSLISDNPNPNLGLRPTSSGMSQYESSQEAKMADAQLASDRDQRDMFTKTMATYLDQVRVCEVCYNIYQMLDWARNTLDGTSRKQGKRTRSSLGDDMSQEEKGPEWGPQKSDSSPNRPSSYSKQRGRSPASGVRALSPLTSNPSLVPTASDSPSPNPNLKAKKRSTWKNYTTTNPNPTLASINNLDPTSNPNSISNPKVVTSKSLDSAAFATLDGYLRGSAKELAERRARERDEFVRRRVAELVPPVDKGTSSKTTATVPPKVHRGHVLLAAREGDHSLAIKGILEEAYFIVRWVKDGRYAVNVFTDDVDCIIVERDLDLGDALFVVRGVREFEKEERKRAASRATLQGRGVQPWTKRHPVICLFNNPISKPNLNPNPDEVKLLMRADMDGCIAFPIDKASLLNTVRAAVPHHLSILKDENPNNLENNPTQRMPLLNQQACQPKVFKLTQGNVGGTVDDGNLDNTSNKNINNLVSNNENISIDGIVQIDADTRVIYSVLDASRNAKVMVNNDKPFFNLVICHDLFDTSERFKIFMTAVVQRYLGMQILLWNYPGQAFTDCRQEQLLNNEYIATCLNEVLGQIGNKGTGDFDTSRPFYILGYGFGVSVATFYSAHYRVPNLRGLISVNGWAYVDSYLAGIMHDCINIFSNAPSNRPDLPVYFFSRFLFSKDYLSKVSVPLALNIYTAVHNPISIQSRIQLCKGVLQDVDLRSSLKEVDVPMICIHSTQDSFARASHSEAFTTCRGGEVRSINRAIREPTKTCVIWMKSGHEVFQECRKPMQLLIEQILTGFHETHDMTFPAAPVVDKTAAEQGMLVSNLPWERDKPLQQQTVEDKFIDSILSKTKSTTSASLSVTSRQGSPIRGNTEGKGRGSTQPLPSSTSTIDSEPLPSAETPGAWEEYSNKLSTGQILGPKTDKKNKKAAERPTIVVDATSTAFERQDSTVYAKKHNAHEFPEVKEYMSWRLKRNKKRLQRLQDAAMVIQNAFRAFLARKIVKDIRRKRAARIIQRCYRGYLGRTSFLHQARRIWATLIIQRNWRGYLSRRWYFLLRLRIAAAANIQRIFRGYQSRLYILKVRRIRNEAACVIQAMFHRRQARKEAFRRRHERNNAVIIQRIYRGHLGRRLALSERDKFIFSKSQSQGIEFGRQMLLDHKLQATKLQSDVTLLTQEKISTEENVELLLEEISSFEEGVRTLEREMSHLSKVEAEAASFMDEGSMYELREQKIRLDKEFGDMLVKIGDRKERLVELERKLATLDKTRQGKEEELRTLERKLVVLLEEQQNEINAIKKKQDVRGAMLAATHEALAKAATVPGSQSQALTLQTGLGVDSNGGSGGPSLQEKKQAAQLMQSTETLMKFGFMSMSMTYFTSLNMIKALRTVSTQESVMTALADIQAQRTADGDEAEVGENAQSKEQHVPELKAGQLSGQETLRVSAWSVEDVAKWLHTITLGQYEEAFVDSAVDGEFLYDLDEEDLKDTLGIEHRLHRKKILNCVYRLKVAEAQQDNRISNILMGTGSMEPPTIGPDDNAPQVFPDNPFKPELGTSSDGRGALQGPGEDRRLLDGPKVKLSELFSYVRHSKLTQLKEAMDYLPNKKFDSSLVQTSFVSDHGTNYVEGYESLPFHVNKVDEFGNTMLTLSCQNGNLKIAKFLLAKGSNPNHQNKTGQTPAHFAINYKFYDLSKWLFQNGAIDTIENIHGLSPYDGLSPEEGPDEAD